MENNTNASLNPSDIEQSEPLNATFPAANPAYPMPMTPKKKNNNLLICIVFPVAVLLSRLAATGISMLGAYFGSMLYYEYESTYASLLINNIQSIAVNIVAILILAVAGFVLTKKLAEVFKLMGCYCAASLISQVVYNLIGTIGSAILLNVDPYSYTAYAYISSISDIIQTVLIVVLTGVFTFLATKKKAK